MISGNRLADNVFAAVENEGSNTSIQTNRFHDDLGLTGVAVWIREGSRGSEVQQNSMRGIGLAGVDDSGLGTVVRLNAIDGRLGDQTLGTFAGIALRPESEGARVMSNAVTRQSQDGIVVSGRDAFVSHNVVADALYGDGIRVGEDARDATVRANLATRHHDDGIEAVAGTNDAGGNRAAGNGNRAQCVGVVCGPTLGG